MDQRWTLHVENIGKVLAADIQIAPLICFVGDNNSGKSYIMTLLWGLINNGRKELLSEVSVSDAESSGVYKKCYEWLKSHLDGGQVEIDAETAYVYISWFNELLNQKKEKLLKKLFNFGVHASKIEIRDFQLGKPIKLFFASTLENFIPLLKNEQKPLLTFGKDSDYEYTDRDLLRINCNICWTLLMRGLGSQYNGDSNHVHEFGEPIYFPASRTGILLTYKQLISNMLEANDAKLTLPYIDFLRLLVKLEPAEEKLSKTRKELLQFIQNQITCGGMKVKKGYIPTFEYRPLDSRLDMPLHVTSSVVTEVAPLALLLQSNIRFRTIVIEEPEAHLHPALQKFMAQCIIRLVNGGYNVWITTHSDVILQHINNMIKLCNNPKRDMLLNQFNYEGQDWISKEKIEMYQFTSYAADLGIAMENSQRRGPAIESDRNTSLPYYRADSQVVDREVNGEVLGNVKNVEFPLSLFSSSAHRGSKIVKSAVRQRGTYVKKLEANEYGFIVPTFNDALEKILDEVYAFQGDED